MYTKSYERFLPPPTTLPVRDEAYWKQFFAACEKHVGERIKAARDTEAGDITSFPAFPDYHPVLVQLISDGKSPRGAIGGSGAYLSDECVFKRPTARVNYSWNPRKCPRDVAVGDITALLVHECTHYLEHMTTRSRWDLPGPKDGAAYWLAPREVNAQAFEVSYLNSRRSYALSSTDTVDHVIVRPEVRQLRELPALYQSWQGICRRHGLPTLPDVAPEFWARTNALETVSTSSAPEI